ncbi:hypothetical protein [Streptomyces sp. NPDC002994]|uniref:hypothetical protein n=1 Tax=Streptomyces sp. NPDC002994 TaxID=3154441 RepID=UPI0033B2E7BA
MAGTLAVTVSAPWLIVAQGRGSYRLLPQLASVISSGRQVLVVTALGAAAATVLAARVTAKGAGPLPQEVVPARAARLADRTVPDGPLVPCSPNRANSWAGPAGAPLGDWLLYRAADVLLLAVVWLALRQLPGLLTRATVPALAAGAVCATVLGLLASRLLRVVMDGAGLRWGLLHLSTGIGRGVPAARKPPKPRPPSRTPPGPSATGLQGYRAA